MLLQELYYNGFFNRKNIIEYLEAELTGAPKETSNTENLAVTEEANIGDAVTVEAKSSNDMENYLKEERWTKSYKDTMNIDIENINTI